MDIDERIDEVLRDLQYRSQWSVTNVDKLYGHDEVNSIAVDRDKSKKALFEASVLIKALIEERERVARIEELNWLHTEHIRHFERDSCDIIKERIEAFHKSQTHKNNESQNDIHNLSDDIVRKVKYERN